MKTLLYSLAVLLLLTSAAALGFKDDQLRYARVRQAYSEKEEIVKDMLADHGIRLSEVQVYFRVFKSEQLVEVWAKNRSDTEFQLVKQYDICASSGRLGPKRQRGDGQIPEGFYSVSAFNPVSSFHLSLKLNYPNPSDRILGVRSNLGGDIFMHGNCMTIGCMPMTDDKIKEIYLLCVEARNNGQEKIAYDLFPTRLTDDRYARLRSKYEGDEGRLGLWADLKTAYDLFDRHKRLPRVTFLNNGRHAVKM